MLLTKFHKLETVRSQAMTTRTKRFAKIAGGAALLGGGLFAARRFHFKPPSGPLVKARAVRAVRADGTTRDFMLNASHNRSDGGFRRRSNQMFNFIRKLRQRF